MPSGCRLTTRWSGRGCREFFCYQPWFRVVSVLVGCVVSAATPLSSGPLGGILMHMKGESMLQLAFCGDDCNFCPRYIATQSGSEEQLKEVAILWKKAGWQEAIVSPEEMVCYGCSSVSRCVYGIKECALEKDVENCGRCQDYPCEKVIKVFERTEVYARKCQEICSQEEYERLQRAFFSKKENLDRANRDYCSQRTDMMSC